jgi:CRISPR/Cas system-associated protein Cas10 (large subunit of type III CRISPR-Cas system)
VLQANAPHSKPKQEETCAHCTTRALKKTERERREAESEAEALKVFAQHLEQSRIRDRDRDSDGDVFAHRSHLGQSCNTQTGGKLSMSRYAETGAHGSSIGMCHSRVRKDLSVKLPLSAPHGEGEQDPADPAATSDLDGGERRCIYCRRQRDLGTVAVEIRKTCPYCISFGLANPKNAEGQAQVLSEEQVSKP